MDTEDEPLESDDDVDGEDSRWGGKDMENLRHEEPSGWLYLTENRAAQYLVDALIDGSPESFNKTELGHYAGFDRKTVRKHIDKLVELGVAEEPTYSNGRYRFNPDSEVSQLILKLDAAVRDRWERSENNEE